MGGATRDTYERWRSELVKCLAHTEALIVIIMYYHYYYHYYYYYDDGVLL